MAYEYKGYNPKNSKHVNKYIKEHYKIVKVNMDKQYYDGTLLPIVKANNDSVSGFVKKALDYYINHLNND